jgi:hypothetical protein
MFLTIASFFSAMCFTLCTATAVYFAVLEDNIGSSAGFALLACWWFILMVVFGYCYIRGKK